MTYVSTIAKIVSLREHLNDSQLVGVLNEFGIPISNAKLSRAIDDGKFSSHDFDQRVRVVVLGIENLVQRLHPWFPISFKDPALVRTTMTLLDSGVLSVNVLVQENGSSIDTAPTDNLVAAQGSPSSKEGTL